MKTIWRMLKADIGRCKGNVTAAIVLIGITIVPSLYAWFNIAASWDPYENTGSLKVAVASKDEGYEADLVPASLNLGDMVLSKLRENTQLDWIFTGEQKAKDGVRSGRYYAAIVLPEDFSRKLLSVFSGKAEHPEILYYLNEKENAVAPKITDKGAAAVQEQINTAFMKTTAEIGLFAAAVFSEGAGKEGQDAIGQRLADRLWKASGDLLSASETVRSFADMTGALKGLLETTGGLLDSAGKTAESGLTVLEDGRKASENAGEAMGEITETISLAIGESQACYEMFADNAREISDAMSGNAVRASESLQGLSGQAMRLIDRYQGFEDALTELSEALPRESEAVTRLLAKVRKAKARQEMTKEKLEEAALGLRDFPEETKRFQKEAAAVMDEGAAALAGIKKEYDETVRADLEEVLSSAQKTSSSVSGLLEEFRKRNGNIRSLSGTAAGRLGQIQETLNGSALLLRQAAENAGRSADMVRNPGSGNLQKLTEQIKGTDMGAMSSLLASPVRLETKRLYPVENYGSAMAPFYSVLSIWVGGIILAAMMRTEVSASAMAKGNVGGKNRILPHQTYLSRLLLFLLLGLGQSTLICLGNLFFLGIQCAHPFLFMLTGWITSFVFVNMIYALTVSFGDIGKAASVILLVVQVSGSGGTFPIETAPGFFRGVYPFLPFVHSMNAMRECIAGCCGNRWAKEIGFLLLFLIPVLLLGFLFRKPVVHLNERFMEKLEETKLM